MKETNKIPELLAPAGDPEKLEFAYRYGADAAYVGGGSYSLRLNAGFDRDDLTQAVAYAHSLGKKLYVAVNSFLRDEELSGLGEYLTFLSQIAPDALILSDPGVFAMARQYAPDLPLHISTQANTTNSAAAAFWLRRGGSPEILSRELSIEQAAAVGRESGIETEVFVHGAMCISYSGRCLLSSFMTGRSANLGNCSHPCRYRYALEEEKRPGEYFPISEDARGTYIMNSRDLCLLEEIPALCESGISSLKIEGRNKSAYYVANAVRVYRAALDAYAADPVNYRMDPAWYEELTRISHRAYTKAFAHGNAGAESMRYEDADCIRDYDFAAILRAGEGDFLRLEQRNHIAVGDVLELLLPNGENRPFPVTALYDDSFHPLEAANNPYQTVYLYLPYEDLTEQLPLILRRPAR